MSSVGIALRCYFMVGTWMIQYHRNRFYDYYTGRWINQDPIGYQDGVNLYA